MANHDVNMDDVPREDAEFYEEGAIFPEEMLRLPTSPYVNIFQASYCTILGALQVENMPDSGKFIELFPAVMAKMVQCIISGIMTMCQVRITSMSIPVPGMENSKSGFFFQTTSPISGAKIEYDQDLRDFLSVFAELILVVMNQHRIEALGEHAEIDPGGRSFFEFTPETLGKVSTFLGGMCKLVPTLRRFDHKANYSREMEFRIVGRIPGLVLPCSLECYVSEEIKAMGKTFQIEYLNFMDRFTTVHNALYGRTSCHRPQYDALKSSTMSVSAFDKLVVGDK